MFALAMIVATSLASADPAVGQNPGDPAIDRGMTAEQVRERLGPPKTVARQILLGRCLEQWTYDHVRIEFDWPKGEPKRILTVQKLSKP